MRNINIGIIGLGTVGSGVLLALKKKKDFLKKKLGVCLDVVKICDSDTAKANLDLTGKSFFTTNANEIIDDPKIDIVVELIGGISDAEQFIVRAIEKGKHIVTANKALLADKKSYLFEKAKISNVELRFEASVAGGIPIIKAIREGFVANNIYSIYGIVNGTCNYILTEMSKNNISFDNALLNAQEKGYAEKDPSLDIDGYDSAHKLAILSSMAFGVDIQPKNIYVEGITAISSDDIRYAAEFGYVVKLLAIAKKNAGQVTVRVHPTLVSELHPLASVDSNFNAIFIKSDMAGDSLFYGQGAGSAPTASAVISDIVDVAEGILNKAVIRIPNIVYDKNVKSIKKKEDFYTSYYVRLSAIDKPGVLAKVSKILAEYDISIASVSQKTRRKEKVVPIVMMSHQAKESALLQAIKKINSLSAIKEKAVVIRTEEEIE